MRDARLPDWMDDEAARTFALIAFEAGNLRPLADLLRRGSSLGEDLRHTLANACDGFDPESALAFVKRGPRSANSKYLTWARDIEIAQFILDRVPHLNNQVEAAFHDAMERFGEKRGVIVSAWSRFKNGELTPP